MFFTDIPLDACPEPSDSAPNPETLSIASESSEDIRKIFASLFTPFQSAVLSRIYLDDSTLEETALHFGMSYGQVRYIQRLGIAKLRSLLGASRDLSSLKTPRPQTR